MGDEVRDVFMWTVDFSALRIVPEFLYGLTIARFVLNGGLDASRPAQGWTVFVLASATMAAAIILFLPLIFILASGALIASLMVVPIPVPKSLHYLGTISYSVYMTHALVEIVGFRTFEIVGGFPDDSVPLWVLGPMLFLVIIAGSLTYHLIELPGRIFLLRKRRPREIELPPENRTLT